MVYVTQIQGHIKVKSKKISLTDIVISVVCECCAFSGKAFLYETFCSVRILIWISENPLISLECEFVKLMGYTINSKGFLKKFFSNIKVVQYNFNI